MISIKIRKTVRKITANIEKNYWAFVFLAIVILFIFIILDLINIRRKKMKKFIAISLLLISFNVFASEHKTIKDLLLLKEYQQAEQETRRIYNYNLKKAAESAFSLGSLMIIENRNKEAFELFKEEIEGSDEDEEEDKKEEEEKE